MLCLRKGLTKDEPQREAKWKVATGDLQTTEAREDGGCVSAHCAHLFLLC